MEGGAWWREAVLKARQSINMANCVNTLLFFAKIPLGAFALLLLLIMGMDSPLIVPWDENDEGDGDDDDDGFLHRNYRFYEGCFIYDDLEEEADILRHLREHRMPPPDWRPRPHPDRLWFEAVAAVEEVQRAMDEQEEHLKLLVSFALMKRRVDLPESVWTGLAHFLHEDGWEAYCFQSQELPPPPQSAASRFY